MKTCPACGRQGHRTSVTATLLDPNASDPSSRTRRARVCASCASGGILLVAPRAVAVPVKGIRAPDSELVSELRKAVRTLQTFANLAGAVAVADGSPDESGAFPPEDELDFMAGRADGLASAVALLEKILKGVPV